MNYSINWVLKLRRNAEREVLSISANDIDSNSFTALSLHSGPAWG